MIIVPNPEKQRRHSAWRIGRSAKGKGQKAKGALRLRSASLEARGEEDKRGKGALRLRGEAEGPGEIALGFRGQALQHGFPSRSRCLLHNVGSRPPRL